MRFTGPVLATRIVMPDSRLSSDQMDIIGALPPRLWPPAMVRFSSWMVVPVPGALPWWCRWPVSASMPWWITNGCAHKCASVMGPGCRSSSRAWCASGRVHATVLRCASADRLAGPRICALQLPAPYACARNALQKTILETGLFLPPGRSGPRRGHFSN